jgi:hypothetical protein
MSHSNNIIKTTISDGYFASCSCGWNIKGLRTAKTAEKYGAMHRAKCTYTGNNLPVQPTNSRYKGSYYDKDLSESYIMSGDT